MWAIGPNRLSYFSKNLFIYICLCVCVYDFACKCPQRPEGGFGFTGVRDPGRCSLSNVGGSKRILVLYESSSCSNSEPSGEQSWNFHGAALSSLHICYGFSAWCEYSVSLILGSDFTPIGLPHPALIWRFVASLFVMPCSFWSLEGLLFYKKKQRSRFEGGHQDKWRKGKLQLESVVWEKNVYIRFLQYKEWTISCEEKFSSRV